MTTTELIHSADAHLYQNYGQRRVALERGSGSYLFDTDGRRYVDFYAGIAVSALGHGHPALVRAIAEQAGKLIHQSNHYLSEPNVALAERLCALTGMDRAFFCNSGTEANEAALKLARRYFYDKGERDRHVVLAFENSFHGRTMGALAVTGSAKYSEGFGPMPGALHVPYGDLGAASRALGPNVAAVIVEPMLGESGIVMPPPGFLAALRQLTSERGALLIVDEIQTGVGRTGTFLASQADGITADVVTLAKGLGGGVPIGAMLTTAALSSVLKPGLHGTTFGGNPLASAAALAVLHELTETNLMRSVIERGAQLTEGLRAIQSRHPVVTEVRGRGLLQAIALRPGTELPPVVAAIRDAGVVLVSGGTNALRFMPPLVISPTELDEGLDIVDRTLTRFD